MRNVRRQIESLFLISHFSFLISHYILHFTFYILHFTFYLLPFTFSIADALTNFLRKKKTTIVAVLLQYPIK